MAEATHNEGRTARKVREGLVVSDKMDKTAVVAVVRLKRHPLYGRVQRVTKNSRRMMRTTNAMLATRVRIMETRPISRDKNWRVLQIVERRNTGLGHGTGLDIASPDP
jgi:small subunit ribosomal protein S17